VSRKAGTPSHSTARSTTDTAPSSATAATLVAVLLLSAALIAYEIVLMRRLLIERWHHFGYLVISTALLGFGASGTLLAILERRVRAQPWRVLLSLALLTGVLLLILPRVAAQLPMSVRFIPADLWRQAGWWSLYWLTAFAPFLVGAGMLGAALMTAAAHVGRVYAANLLGSAAGAAGAVLLVSHFPTESGYRPAIALAFAGAAVLAAAWSPAARRAGRFWKPAGIVLVAVALLAGDTLWPLAPAYDEHKYAALLRQLVAQGQARRVAAVADPHGYIELYESPLFHDVPFLAPRQAPPPVARVVINGDAGGSVLRIEAESQAAFMDDTLMALPYCLVAPRPRVLLLGETGGADVWLGRRQNASRIDLVQPNAALLALLRSYTPALFSHSGVRVCAADALWFLRTAARGGQRWDLAQLASLEGLGGSAGVQALAEDHLLTVAGLRAVLERLDSGGLLAITRGLQFPERENIRLFATLVESLESLGVSEPARHLVQVRDYLGVCTMALRSPLSDPQRAALRAALRELHLTPVWYDGIRPEEVNQPDALQGPPGTEIDWLHYAAREILSPRRETFYGAWLFNIRPPHHHSPFFWDFYRPQALPELKRAYGGLWLTRAEVGRIFLHASLLVATGAAVVLILLPLAFVAIRARRGNRPSDTIGAVARPGIGRVVTWTLVYFGAIGLGFMGIEMALISRAIGWVGDPVIASAGVIAGVLVLSGLGSLSAERVTRGRRWLAPALVAALAAAAGALAWSDADSTSVLTAALAALTAVLAYFMGVPMPAGLRWLDQRAPQLVPWAWGVNGVASVIATGGALVVAMDVGYRHVMLLAAALYALTAFSALTSIGGPGQPRAGPSSRAAEKRP